MARSRSIFKLLGLRPHPSESFRLSTSPFFIEKLCYMAGLYLSPQENALVLSVDKKSQCQELERTRPMLRMGLGTWTTSGWPHTDSNSPACAHQRPPILIAALP
jgi:hypothetical protein